MSLLRLSSLNSKFVHNQKSLLSSSISLNNFYQVLSVSHNASLDEIKKKFREKSLECHPDKFPDDKRKEDQFKAISEAYQTLSDKTLRQKYNNTLNISSRPRSNSSYTYTTSRHTATGPKNPNDPNQSPYGNNNYYRAAQRRQAYSKSSFSEKSRYSYEKHTEQTYKPNFGQNYDNWNQQANRDHWNNQTSKTDEQGNRKRSASQSGNAAWQRKGPTTQNDKQDKFYRPKEDPFANDGPDARDKNSRKEKGTRSQSFGDTQQTTNKTNKEDPTKHPENIKNNDYDYKPPLKKEEYLWKKILKPLIIAIMLYELIFDAWKWKQNRKRKLAARSQERYLKAGMNSRQLISENCEPTDDTFENRRRYQQNPYDINVNQTYLYNDSKIQKISDQVKEKEKEKEKEKGGKDKDKESKDKKTEGETEAPTKKKKPKRPQPRSAANYYEYNPYIDKETALKNSNNSQETQQVYKGEPAKSYKMTNRNYWFAPGHYNPYAEKKVGKDGKEQFYWDGLPAKKVIDEREARKKQIREIKENRRKRRQEVERSTNKKEEI